MSLNPHDALANLAAYAETWPSPYLVSGPQAAYMYHRWLLPISKMIDLSIPPENVATWEAILGPPWVVLTNPPSYLQMHNATRLAILDPHLSKKRYARRVIHQGVPFISPEDLCLDLLRNAKTSLGLSEIAALLIEQRETLDWSYLLSEIGSSWLGDRLREIISSINRVAGRTLIATRAFLPALHAMEPTTAPLVSKKQRKQTKIYLDDSLVDILRPLQAQWEGCLALKRGLVRYQAKRAKPL